MGERGNETFGSMLRQLRRSAGITQGELAKGLGTNPSAISLFETGRRCPSKGTLGRIATVLKLSQAEFAELSWHAVTPTQKRRRDGDS